MFFRKHWLLLSVLLIAFCALSFYLLRSDVSDEPIKIYKVTTPLPKQMDIRDPTPSNPPPEGQTDSIPTTDAQTSKRPESNTLLVDMSAPLWKDKSLPAAVEDGLDEPQADVPVSPFGFGPYPEVPADYFGDPIWVQDPNILTDFPDHALKNIELIHRVLIKLWQQGDRAIVGGSTAYGKIYPHYDNVFYVRWEETPLSDGSVDRYISDILGADHEFTFDDIETGNIPPNFEIVDFDDAGYDPYEFLNLEHLDNY